MMELLEQKSFIKGIPPFDKLPPKRIEEIAKSLDIAYFQEDTTILAKHTMPEFLYFIIKGVVQEREGDEVLALYSAHDYFDGISLIEGDARHSFVTVEETLCYLLPRELFLSILREERALEHYFFQSIAQKLQEGLQEEQNKALADFMVARVEDAYIRAPLFCDAGTTIYDAARLQHAHRSDTLLVRDGERTGIVTDRDYRERFVLKRCSFDDPIEKLATFELVRISQNAFLFNAQLKMTGHGIKRLIVEDENGEIVGILDQLSLASYFASHTYAIASEIDGAQTLSELKCASEGFIRIVKALYAKGVKVRYIARLITALNTKLFEKTFTLLAPKELQENAALIVMGSEGRGEQILKTDQDNALIIRDTCPLSDEEIAVFAAQFTRTLIDFGYPPCKGNIMLSNPKWRKRTTEYREQITNWIERKHGDDMMDLAIFYDASAVAGESALLDGLKKHLLAQVAMQNQFIPHFAKAVENFETPLGLFSDFVVEKSGLHKSEMDLKKGGIFAIVHGTRALALEKGILATNTVERLKALNDMGVLEREFTRDLMESLTYLWRLLLKCNLERIEKGVETSNFVNPSQLSKIEKDLLKDALKIVNQYKKFLIYHYKLTLLG